MAIKAESDPDFGAFSVTTPEEPALEIVDCLLDVISRTETGEMSTCPHAVSLRIRPGHHRVSEPEATLVVLALCGEALPLLVNTCGKPNML